MLAPQNEPNDITDTLSGSLTSWYQNIDSALKASECVPGYYEYQAAPSYGTQCPIQEGGSTKIDIHTARFNVISIDNSYIDVDFTVPVTINNIFGANESNTDGNNTEPYMYYIGFKSAFDLFEQYRIYSNGELIYTQNQPYYESFLNYISLTDSAKENSECYATLSKLRNMKANVPGTYIEITNQNQNITIPVNIKFKIPLNNFLMLQNLKWFPGFMGDLTIEIFPTYKNLVWAKLPTTNINNSARNGASYIKGNSFGANNAAVNSGYCDFEDIYELGIGFNQINDSNLNAIIYAGAGHANANNWLVKRQTFSANTSTLNKFQLYTAFYMLKMDVYNALEYNYLQVPLLFPIQTVSNVKFTSSLGNSTHQTLQNTATLSHCDTIFVVFPKTVNDRTVFKNPEINCQLNINGKFYPRERYSTIGDPRFYNMELDSLNINNNPLFSIAEDVASSIMPYKINVQADTTANVNTFYTYYSKIINGDVSNFFIGIPLSTDEDFMGGISSNGSTVQIELHCERNSHNPNINAEDWTQAPEAIFLEDKLLKIYSMKPAGRKQIDITNATLEQIAAGAL